MKIIKNYRELAVTEARKKLLDIIEAGISSVHPHALIERSVRYNKNFNSVVIQNNSYDLISGRIFVVGGGKAAGFMAEKFEEIIGAENITAGAVNCTDSGYRTKKIRIVKTSHPLPDRHGIKGVERMLALKAKYDINEKDLVVFLISGGGSSLLPGPVPSVSLKDTQVVTRRLLESGANIREINTVRKHLSRIKGGQLGAHFAPAKVATIIISDVIGNDLDTIASGPTVSDRTTFMDALAVLKKYGIWVKAPKAVRTYLERGSDGQAPETPKHLENCDHYIIGDVAVAMEAMSLKARSIGLKPLIVTNELSGETEKTAIDRAGEIMNGEYKGYDLLLFGGETTPKLPPGYGKGGRNQHYAAVSMFALADCKNGWTMSSVATDGVDYLTDAAGAVIDNNTLARSRQHGLEAEKLIEKYDTNTLFRKIGNTLIRTGYTGTNVGDVAVYLVQ